MSTTPPVPGSIGWCDLTVLNADEVRDFYVGVAGWTPHAVQMEGYADHAMLDSSGKAVAGVCWARGVNADIPPCWMVYISVSDLDASLAQVERLGGRRAGAVKGSSASGRMCMIADPAGALFMLYEAPAAQG